VTYSEGEIRGPSRDSIRTPLEWPLEWPSNPFVTLDTSTIKEAGNGLFAAVCIDAETRIGTYSGVKTFGKQLYCTKSDYAITSACGTLTIDAHDAASGPFRTINDCLIEEQDNIQFRKNGNEIEVWMIRDVKIDEELFVSYDKIFGGNGWTNTSH